MNSRRPQSVVIIGATSAIAVAVAQELAPNGTRFFLVARDEERARSVAADLLSRGAKDAAVYVADLRSRDAHAHIEETASSVLGTIDCVLVAHGVLQPQEVLDADVDAMVDNFMVNAVSFIAIIHRFAALLEGRGAGMIVGLSSVAGERGRRSNYVYGAAKSAITTYLSGLRMRLAPVGVHVLTVKPGPVATPMTENVPMPLKVGTAVVAKAIVNAIEKRKAEVYTPAFWRLIMAIVRALPEWVMRLAKY